MKKQKQLIDLVTPKDEPGFERDLTSDDFEYLENLGQGSFASVTRVRLIRTSKIYALKAIKKQLIIQTRKSEQVLLELKIMYQLNHENVLRLHGHFEDDDNINLVLDYLANGSLYDKLQQNGYLVESDAIFYMRQIVSAIKYLHEQQTTIIHRDIKPENILLDDKDCIKLADFGSANSVTQDNQYRYTYTGSQIYMAPEIIEKQGYNQTIDIWSLGVLIYELLAGETPFLSVINRNTLSERDQQTILEENIKQVKITFPDNFPPLARDLIRKMLKKDPLQRITLKEVLEHPWLKQNVNNKLNKYSQQESEYILTRQQKIQQCIQKFQDSHQNEDYKRKKQQFQELKQKMIDLKSQVSEQQVKVEQTKLENNEFKKQLKELEMANEQDIYHSIQTEELLERKISNMQYEIMEKETQVAKSRNQIDQLQSLEEKVKRERKTIDNLEQQLLELDEKKTEQSRKLQSILEHFTELNNENNISIKNQPSVENEDCDQKIFLKKVVQKLEELLKLHNQLISNISMHDDSSEDEIETEKNLKNLLDDRLDIRQNELQNKYEEKRNYFKHTIAKQIEVVTQAEAENQKLKEQAQVIAQKEQLIVKGGSIIKNMEFSYTIKSEKVKELRDQKFQKEQKLIKLQEQLEQLNT